jgi:hypothetical protein
MKYFVYGEFEQEGYSDLQTFEEERFVIKYIEDCLSKGSKIEDFVVIKGKKLTLEPKEKVKSVSIW